ncbi:MAG: 4Fe-4S binding protein [Planctomycetes bacterium]|nr:4Fe-4S binding protein [Planctomycetota bacterium]
MTGKIIIDIEKCKGCGLCVMACPKGQIVISEKSNKKGYFPAKFKASDNCSGCAMCAIICPDAAIKVYKNCSTTKANNAQTANSTKGKA